MQRVPGVVPFIGSIAAFLIGFMVVRFLGLETSIRIIAGTLVGLLVTLPAFFMARKRNRPVFAHRSLVGGATCGALGGAILSVPVGLVLSIVVWRRGAAPVDQAGAKTADTPLETEITITSIQDSHDH